MSRDLISIIVPVYNTGNLLIDCVNSLIAQEYSPIEIILVNDGSTDERTLSICDEFAQKFNNIRVISQNNGGPSKARNTGIDNAKGKFIGFVDSDDYIDKDAYSHLYKMASEYEVPLVLGKMDIIGAKQYLTRCELNEGKYTQKEILAKFMLGNWHSACTNLYSKSLIENIRFPLNEINEDYIFNFEVILKAKEIAVLNKAFYHYVKHNESRTGAPASMKHIDWLKHTEYVRNRVISLFPNELRNEANYQLLYSNIVLSNKCLLSIAAGFKEEASELYEVTTGNLKKDRHEIFRNVFLSLRLRLFALALSIFPVLYKNLILTIIKLRR